MAKHGTGFFGNYPQQLSIVEAEPRPWYDKWKWAAALTGMAFARDTLRQESLGSSGSYYPGRGRGNVTNTPGNMQLGSGGWKYVRRGGRNGYAPSIENPTGGRTFRLMGRRNYYQRNPYRQSKKFRCSMVPAGFRSYTPQTAYRWARSQQRGVRHTIRRNGFPMRFNTRRDYRRGYGMWRHN
jgi:hypothetical protein